MICAGVEGTGGTMTSFVGASSLPPQADNEKAIIKLIIEFFNRVSSIPLLLLTLD
jgi:hypothetical protein